MGKRKNVSQAVRDDEMLDDLESWEGRREDRTLVLKAVPRSRKVQLMAQGAKEIRCGCCGHIRPIAGAEEVGELWICEDCLPPGMRLQNTGEGKGTPRRRRANRSEVGLTVRL